MEINHVNIQWSIKRVGNSYTVVVTASVLGDISSILSFSEFSCVLLWYIHRRLVIAEENCEFMYAFKDGYTSAFFVKVNINNLFALTMPKLNKLTDVDG